MSGESRGRRELELDDEPIPLELNDCVVSYIDACIVHPTWVITRTPHRSIPVWLITRPTQV
jgi:hypothetical protein